MRTEEIKIRLSFEEKSEIQDLAREHRVSCADLIRCKLLGANKAKKLPSRDLLTQIFRQAAGIGTNINQIAKHVNEAVQRNHHKMNADDVIKLKNDLQAYKKEHTEIIQLLKEALKK